MQNMIVKYRKNSGLTQEEVGRALGHGRAAINKIESKPIEKVTIGDLFAFARLFNCHPWELMGLPQNFGIDNNSIIREELNTMSAQLSRTLDKIAQMTKDEESYGKKSN